MGRIFWIAVAMLGVGLILLVINDSSGQVLGLDTGQFGSLVYLGALGALVASGIVASNRRFGDTARTLAAWLLVILVLMAGYQYRYELQDVASRVSGGLVPGSPLSLVDGDGHTTVTLQKRLDGHFQADLEVDGTPDPHDGRHGRDEHRADGRGRRTRRLRPGFAQLHHPGLDRQRHGTRGARRRQDRLGRRHRAPQPADPRRRDRDGSTRACSA